MRMVIFHNSCPLRATSMNKVIHTPLHFNDDVTKTDIGTNFKGHFLLSTRQISLQKSCPCGLKVLIFFFPNYYLLHVKQVRRKKQNPNNKKTQQPFCTMPSTWITILAKFQKEFGLCPILLYAHPGPFEVVASFKQLDRRVDS